MIGESDNRAMIPATIIIDRGLIAAPAEPRTPSPLLEQVRGLLEELAERRTADEAIAVDAEGAAKLLGMSQGWVRQNTAPRGQCIPSFMCGSKPRYRIDALRAWCEQQEGELDGRKK